jgi:hypothetical protein
LEKEIAVTSIALFDDLCIKHAYDEKFFYTAMGKLADKKLARDEYEEFFRPVPVNSFVTQDFYRVPILEGKANIIAGWVGLSNRARNCIVILEITKEIASGYWLSLYKVSYERTSPRPVFAPAPRKRHQRIRPRQRVAARAITHRPPPVPGGINPRAPGRRTRSPRHDAS